MEDMHGSYITSGDPGLQAHLSAGSELPHRDPYLVKSVVHASQILSAFRDNAEVLPLKEVVRRCGLPKSMVFRLLYTMSTCHIVEKLQNNRYQLATRPVDAVHIPEAIPKKRRISTGPQVPQQDGPHNGQSSGLSAHGS
jgi:hypothetical protein